MKIIKKEKVYLDGTSYFRVYFEESMYFEDIECEAYEHWKMTLEHVEVLRNA